jgi:hypothetical protein
MRPGYFDPGTTISFWAAACADIGCCANATALVTAQMAAAVVATVTDLKKCIVAPEFF